MKRPLENVWIPFQQNGDEITTIDHYFQKKFTPYEPSDIILTLIFNSWSFYSQCTCCTSDAPLPPALSRWMRGWLTCGMDSLAGVCTSSSTSTSASTVFLRYLPQPPSCGQLLRRCLVRRSSSSGGSAGNSLKLSHFGWHGRAEWPPLFLASTSARLLSA